MALYNSANSIYYTRPVLTPIKLGFRQFRFAQLWFFFNWDSLHAGLSSQPLRGMELQEKEAQKD